MSLKNYTNTIKPREQAQHNGIESLSYQELLAIILRTGSKEKNVLELSGDVLKMFDNLYDLKTASIEELRQIDGIGIVKATEILAAVELGKRLTIEKKRKHGKIVSSIDLGQKLILEMNDYQQEHFVVLYLNSKNEIIQKKTLFIGSLNHSVAHPREIFKLAVKYSSARLIAVHNHPSGDPTPSKQDISFTCRLVECGKLMGISVLDHLIIGENSYVSLKELGEI